MTSRPRRLHSIIPRQKGIFMTEREKLELGLWYDANHDEELLRARQEAEALYFELNHTNPRDTEKKTVLLNRLLPHAGNHIEILIPFYTDYGYNCVIGDDTFINHNAYLMDCARITIGKRCFIGPGCGIYTASHPLAWEDRNRGLEKALPVTVGNHVWIGAGVTILPGVTIGDGSVIGAGSVVTRDIPPDVIAAGNPCRVLRPVTEQDRISFE